VNTIGISSQPSVEDTAQPGVKSNGSGAFLHSGDLCQYPVGRDGWLGKQEVVSLSKQGDVAAIYCLMNDAVNEELVVADLIDNDIAKVNVIYRRPFDHNSVFMADKWRHAATDWEEGTFLSFRNCFFD